MQNFYRKKRYYANKYTYNELVVNDNDDGVSDLVGNIVKKLDKTNKCLGIILDLSKAFVNIHVNTLFLKLERSGIKAKPLQVYRDYLTNRKQCVKIGELIWYGVSQGTKLELVHFLIYFNKLCTYQILTAKSTLMPMTHLY